MAIVLVTSASGSPGVTSTAIGLALVWPKPVLLADCDRTASQAVLAGYLRGTDAGGVGLTGLARAHREARCFTSALTGETIPLAFGDVQRMFLPGFATPGAAHLFDPAWGALGDTFAALSQSGMDVVVDVGRMGPLGPPAGLLMQADAVLVVTRSHLPALSAVRLHLPILVDGLERARGAATGVGLVVIGEGRPYTAEEISRQFNTAVAGTVIHDPTAAAVLGEGTPEPRRYGDSRYIRSLRALSSAVVAQIERQRRRIGGAS